MVNMNNLTEIGTIKLIGDNKYREFVEILPNPNFLRHHYFEMGKNLESETHLTEIIHHPQLLSQLVNKAMILNINNYLKDAKKVN